MPRVELPAAIVAEITGPALDGELAVINRDPAPDERGVPLSSTIALDVVAFRGARIDLAGLRLDVAGVLAVDGGAIASAFAGPRASIDARFDVVHVVLDPAVPFGSEAEVAITIEVRSVGGGPWTARYRFFAEDRTSPRVLAAVAIDANMVRVGFDEPVRPRPGASARFVARSAPAVPLRASHTESNAPTTIDVVVTPTMTPDVEYEIALDGIEDPHGNVVLPPHDRTTFSGFRPQRPPGRRFDLWSMLPKHNRRRDETGDLGRFVACLQEVVDLLLADVDRMPREIDLERASERSLDAILRDLGNPFALELDDAQHRRLAASLVEMYRMKGTAVGIRRALAFFLAIDAEILPYASTALVLGESELDHDWELGPSARFARYAFDVRSARALSAYERHLVRQLVEYIKPAHTHFIELIEPLVAAAPDHWELGESDLDETALLH